MGEQSSLDQSKTPNNVAIESSWKELLQPEFDKPYFLKLTRSLKKEIELGKIIYPAGAFIFQAFAKTPFHRLRVVILGQDPYHNPGEAMGLSFSVPKGTRVPPSLGNIFKELKEDVGFQTVGHGDLSYWAEQGVLLLNAMLTVEKNSPKSHEKLGWQNFTDAVLSTISKEANNVVFMLWGAYARKKADLIDSSKHLILEAAHPSPLARGAYFGSKHFSKANAYLEAHGKSTINWQLPE